MNFLKLGIKNADELASLLLPAIKNMGDRGMAQKAIDGLRELGAKIPRFADDLVVVPKRTPGPSAPRPAFGTREIPRDMGPGRLTEDPGAVNEAIARVRASQASRAPVPEFGSGVRIETPLTRMPRNPKQVINDPLEGTQLRIPFTQPDAGARAYSYQKSSVSPKNVAANMVETLADLTPEESAELLARQAAEYGVTRGPGRYNMGGGNPGAIIRQNVTNANPGELVLRDPRGVNTVDLNALLKAGLPPAAAVAAGGATGILSRLGLDPTGETTASVPSPVNPLFAENDGTPLGTLGVPNTNTPVDTGVPSTSTSISTSGGEQNDSDVRAALAQSDPMAAALNKVMEPMSPEKYTAERGGIAQYYADRKAYAESGPARKRVGDMLAVAMEADPNLKTWAQNHPALAYELVRSQMADPNANQQPLTETVSKTTSQMGSDNVNNAEGNADATAKAAVDQTQGAYDLKAATDPNPHKELRRSVAEYQAIFNQNENLMRRRGM